MAETWAISWIPVPTGVVVIDEAAEEQVAAAPEVSACEPVAHADSRALASTRRRAARIGAASTNGTAAHAPLIALVLWRACCSFVRARRTRALAFTSVMPRAPATSS